jgi:hypothetical protein
LSASDAKGWLKRAVVALIGAFAAASAGVVLQFDDDYLLGTCWYGFFQFVVFWGVFFNDDERLYSVLVVLAFLIMFALDWRK